MNDITIRLLIMMIDNWRSLKASVNTNLSSQYLLKEYEESCPHDIVAFLSSRYYDDGLMDPDYYSSYRCLQCGADISNKYMHKHNGLEFNMHCFNSEYYYSDEEKFAFLEIYLRKLNKNNPKYSIKEAIKLANNHFRKN